MNIALYQRFGVNGVDGSCVTLQSREDQEISGIMQRSALYLGSACGEFDTRAKYKIGLVTHVRRACST